MLRAELLTELKPPPVRRFDLTGQVDWAKKLVKNCVCSNRRRTLSA
jgi:hypothetical protein